MKVNSHSSLSINQFFHFPLTNHGEKIIQKKKLFILFLHRPELKNAIKEGGIPFNRVYGSHAFEYPSMDSRFNQIFNTAMINHTKIIMTKVIETYKGFEVINKLVDVGGGLGVNINLVTSKYPHIKGINFDLPHVLQHAPSYPGMTFLQVLYDDFRKVNE